MRRKCRKTSGSTVRLGVAPTKERRRQNGGVVAETIYQDANGKALIKRYRAVCECVLDAYLRRKAISEPQHRAGLRFRRAYYRAILSRGAAYERLRKASPPLGFTHSERMLKQAYRTLSPQYKGAVIDICGHDQPAQDMAKLDRLQKGLGQLAGIWQTVEAEIFGH